MKRSRVSLNIRTDLVQKCRDVQREKPQRTVARIVETALMEWFSRGGKREHRESVQARKQQRGGKY